MTISNNTLQSKNTSKSRIRSISSHVLKQQHESPNTITNLAIFQEKAKAMPYIIHYVHKKYNTMDQIMYCCNKIYQNKFCIDILVP